jgi:hypothetical protein
VQGEVCYEERSMVSCIVRVYIVHKVLHRTKNIQSTSFGIN